jgi:hypothetical protein
VIPEENLRDFAVVDRCLTRCKTTRFDTESLEYRGGQVTYRKFPEQGTGLIKPVFSALARLDRKI